MADSTLGRANVELGADASKVAPQIDAAKAQVVEGVREIQQAVDAAPITPRVQAPAMGDDAAYQASLQRLAMRQADEQEEMWRRRGMARGTSDLPAASTIPTPTPASIGAWTRLRGVINGTGDGMQGVARLGSLLGRAAWATGIATAAYKAGGAIREYVVEALKSGTERANEFKASLDLSDAQGSISAIAKELSGLNGEIEAGQTSTVDAIYNAVRGKGKAALEEQRAELNKTLAQLRAAESARKIRDRRDSQQEQMTKQMEAFTKQLEKLTNTTFASMEVNIARVADLVAAMKNRVGRDG